MKQFLVLIVAMFSIAAWADSPPDPIPLETNPKEEPIHGEIFRTPIQNLVEAFYDSDSHTVIIIGDPTVEAEVFLYDESGNIEDYSPTINATLKVSSKGSLTIVILSEHWYAIGTFSI